MVKFVFWTLFIDELVRDCVGHYLISNYETEPPYMKILI